LCFLLTIYRFVILCILTLFASVLQKNSIEERTLLGRLGKTTDMASAVAFLASSDASYITGETLVVAGGLPSRL
jgi:NAD(P)-dependent dehydrogenase (short-subunit alcohol dehydrogenase family)